MYASNTSVSTERSRGELERILAKYGASAFGYMSDGARSVVAFKAHGKSIKFILPLARLDDFRNNAAGARRSSVAALAAAEQANRARWRALNLCVKAKLEAVECGITSFEQEFLAHFVLPNGETMGDYAIPMIEEATKNGRMPQLLLG
jgi:hypothetical protein